MSIPAVRIPEHTPIGRIIGLVLALAAILTVIVLAFSWPGVTSEPKNLPVAISGEAAQVQQVTAALEENAEGLLDLIEVDNAVEASALIENRTVYGAIILTAPPEVLTSSAASPVVAQLLTGLAGRLEAMANQAAAAQGIVLPQPITVTVTDVVPLSDTDPRGSGLASVSFPLLFGGILGGIAISLTVVGVWRRVGALLGYVIVGGLAICGIRQAWFGVLQGNYLVNAGAIALSLLAIAAPMVGLSALFGRPGLAIGAVLFVLVANPIASAALPPQFLPEPWGAIGAWFPPGAAAVLMRDLSYFPEADIGFPVAVLACWAIAGLVLAVVGPFKHAEQPATV
ncbi:MAG: ABC transporter permease [Mycetocola sp.]